VLSCSATKSIVTDSCPGIMFTIAQIPNQLALSATRAQKLLMQCRLLCGRLVPPTLEIRPPALPMVWQIEASAKLAFLSRVNPSRKWLTRISLLAPRHIWSIVSSTQIYFR
jgi:hypothetical protein